MNATKELIEDMKAEEKAKKKARLGVIERAAQKVKDKKEGREEALAMGATMTKAEQRAARRAAKKPGALVEVKERKKAKGKTRADEETLLKKYPHMVKGSLGYDTKANKATATIKCQSGASEDCDKTRDVYTSDLFQIKACRHCLKVERNKKRNKTNSAKAKAHGSVNKARKATRKAKKQTVNA